MSSIFSRSNMLVWTMWLVASIFYAYQYILRVLPNIMLEDIMSQFNIGAGIFGQFSGVYYIGYSLMHLPIGIMLDRYGPKKIITICVLMTVVGMSPLIYSSYWVYPVLGRALIGMGSSAAILGLFKIIRMIFNEKNFPRMLSLSVTIGLIGAIYGGGPISYMRETLGFVNVIYILMIAGIVLAFITYFSLPDVQESQSTSVMSDVREVMTNKKVVLSCIFAGLMVGPLEGFADVWGTVFLKQVYGYESTLAASFPSMIFIGMCFGAPILSYIAEKIGNYLMTVVGAGFIMSLCFMTLLFGHLPSEGISLNFLIVGLCCAYQILAIYKASTYVREQVAGLTTAVANMIIMIFGYAFHTVIGGVVTYIGGPVTSQALVYGISVIPIALTLGATGFLYLYTLEKRVAVKAA